MKHVFIQNKFIKMFQSFCLLHSFPFFQPLFLQSFMYLNYLTEIKYVFLLNGTIQIHKSTSAFEGGSKPDVSTSFIKVVLYTLGAHTKRYLMPVLTAFMFMFLARRTINAICLIAMHVCLLKISDEADK